MTWLDTLSKSLQDSFHAIPNEDDPDFIKRLPSQHRLYNAAGMFGMYLIGGELRDILRGFNNKGEEIEKDEVFAPLRFLHGALHHNPHSDLSLDRWRKLVCQIVPALFGAAGAILGSVLFFKRNGREGKMGGLKSSAKQGEALGIFDADAAVSHNQSWVMRVLAGVFATFSAASGLTVLYGIFLNSAFSLSNNRKMMAGAAEFTGINALRAPTHTTGDSQFGPQDSLERLIKETGDDFQRWAKAGIEPSEEDLKKLTKKLVNGTLLPLLPEYTKENEATLREAAKNLIAKAYTESKASLTNATPADIAKKGMSALKDKFFEGGFSPVFNVKDGSRLADEDKRVLKGGLNFIKTLMTDFDISKDELKKARLGNNGMGSWADKIISQKPLMEAWKKMVDLAPGRSQ